MSVPQLRPELLVSEQAAKAILSKVRQRVYICTASGTLVGEDGWCPKHDEDQCVAMFIEYRETVEAIRREF